MNKIEYIKTSWVTIFGTLFIIYIFLAIWAIYDSYYLNDSSIINALSMGFVGGAFSVLFFWSIAWLPLLILFITIEYFLIKIGKLRLFRVLVFESVIMSLVFLSLAQIFNESMWLLVLFSFLIAQWIRKATTIKTSAKN